MIQVSTDGFTRITKAAAQKRYERGHTCYMYPANLRAGNVHLDCAILRKGEWPDNYGFWEILAEFEEHHCRSSRNGRYAAIYVRDTEI